MQTVNIESLCAWSAPKEVSTRNGRKLLRKAAPSADFRRLFGSSKRPGPEHEALKAAGVNWDKDRQTGEWMAVWWLPAAEQKPEAATATATVSEAAASPADAAVKAACAAVFAPPASSLPPGVVLSEEQVEIHGWFETGVGNLVVDAKAGTGKTFTITHGFSRVRTNGDFVYLVFNKKNQREALSKIADPRVTVLTLNACGYRFCRTVWSDAKPDDEVEGDRARACSPGIPDEAVSAVERLVAFAKNLFIGVPSEAELMQTALDRGVFCGLQDEQGQDEYPVGRLAGIARLAMQSALDAKDPAGRISFNDQVWLAVSKGWVRPSFDLVVVDETQDMNVPQLAMVQRMARKGGRVCVVGDPRQCIYTFRGAHPDGMGMMTRALAAKVLGLTVTRRCPQVVVRHVNPIVPEYRAAPDAPEGVLDSCNQQALFERLAVGDAVLSRTNAPLMPLCLSLLRKGVPARIEGRDIGRQLVGMVRKLKARSVPDFMRRLYAWGDKQKARLDVGKTGPAKCAAVDDQVQTLAALAEGCANVSEIEARIDALFVDSDDKNAKPSVVLSSTHKAKGLEWDRVALLSWTYRRTRKGMTDEQKQEEENLYYVACTRAKKQLTLVSEGGQPAAAKN